MRLCAPPLASQPAAGWAELRESFYEAFAGRLIHAVERIASPPRACWCDFAGAFNHVWLYPFLSPTASRPELPWVGRISVNILDPMLVPPEVSHSLGVSSWYPDWHLELTVLPEQLLDFAAWLADLASAHDDLWPDRVPAPPHRLQRPLSRQGLLEAAALWSVPALELYERFRACELEREARLRRRGEYLLALSEMQAPRQVPPSALQTG
jgi:hypothetical protein